MKCGICNEEYPLFYFLSLRNYDGEKLVEKLDFCNECLSKLAKEKIDELKENGFEGYEISRCLSYYDCEKIDNIRMKCEKKEALVKKPRGMYDILTPKPIITWCDPATAGMIKVNVKLYELLDQYDKNSTELSENMLKYTRNMHHLTWVLLGFAAISFILTCITVYTTFISVK